MSAEPVIAPPRVAGLHTRRCVRHPAREAAARCRGCEDFFCRECVVEHRGRLLCAQCLAKATSVDERRRKRAAFVLRAVRAAAGVAALWLVFYTLGAALLKTPADFHDGTIWKKAVGESAP
jgi:hypothetical protein